MTDGLYFELAPKNTDFVDQGLNRNFPLTDGVSLMMGQEMDNALTASG